MIFTLLIIFINSCTQDNILDLKPINNISIDDVHSSTPSLIASSVNGVQCSQVLANTILLQSMVEDILGGHLFSKAIIEEDVVNTATFYQLTYTNTYDPTTANNVYYWVDGYRLINRANL